MISRRTAIAVASVYEAKFRRHHSSRTVHGNSYYTIDRDDLYDFLFKHDYAAWFCNAAKAICSSVGTRAFKEFIMKLHTGEAQAEATSNWSWEQRQLLGQTYLRNLAEDILNDWTHEADATEKKSIAEETSSLVRSLELDGYIYKDAHVLLPESDVLNVREEIGVLESLYTSLRLGNKEAAIHFLRLSEEHYLTNRWSDSIHNSRNFLECVLKEVAVDHSLKVTKVPLTDATIKRPVAVRDYLAKEGLFESKEKEAISYLYGLLSETGSHPYMASNDQARLLRQLALTISQFVMLRYQGKLIAAAS